MKKVLLPVLAVLWAGVLAADNDIDLPINGDFRGRPSGYSPAPGWTLTADGGAARILPTRDRNEFCLELAAPPTRSQSAVSALHPLPGSVLKLEAKVSGSGSASVGYETFDGSRRTVIAADRQVVRLAPGDQKVKRYFTLTAPAKYIRIRLTAEAGSLARFRDVEAEVSGPVLTAPQAAPAPGTIAAPAPGTISAPAPGTISAPAPGTIAAPAPAAAPANVAGPAPVPAPVTAKLLVDDSYFSFDSLGQDEHYTVSLPTGSDIDFDLGENPGSQLYWRLVSYNPSVCRVKLEHDRDGVFPFYRYKAEIELKAMITGRTDVVFACGTKRFTVHFTAQ